MAARKRVAAKRTTGRKAPAGTKRKPAGKRPRAPVSRPVKPARKRRSRVEMALVRVARSLIELAEAMERSREEKTAFPALARELTKMLPDATDPSRRGET